MESPLNEMTVISCDVRGSVHESVDAMFEKYRNHPYMLDKLQHYLCDQLPSALETMEKTYQERKQRIAVLTTEQDHFIQSFLQTNQYFYVPATDKYFYYDGFNYKILSEDDIMHHVLMSINHHTKRQLMVWKQRTKVYVMKRIRDNRLLTKSVPESDTIQHVLNLLYPALFASKSEAKYFLTILGDNLFRKMGDLVHIISPKAKPFLREIVNISQYMFGANAGTTFKHKYYEHEYANCRMVHVNDAVETENVWGNVLSHAAIELLCVAAHYSIRYQNSDTFLSEFSHDEQLAATAFYLKTHSKEYLVREFVGEYVQVERRLSASSESEMLVPTTAITWRNMQFLWKHFLRSRSLPAVMFQQTLKELIVDALGDHYREETDSFVGITSKHMPQIRRFLSFWEETITVGDSVYEIDELCTLFKRWMGANSSASMIGDRQMQDLIAFYFPEIEMENHKYVYGIRCSLWDKPMDIQESLDHLKEYLNGMREDEQDGLYFAVENGESFLTTGISIHDMYLWYCKYMQDKYTSKTLLVSKSFFEKYIVG